MSRLSPAPLKISLSGNPNYGAAPMRPELPGPRGTGPPMSGLARGLDDARIFGGMHFHHSVKEGNRLGRRVADYILAHKFCRADEACV